MESKQAHAGAYEVTPHSTVTYGQDMPARDHERGLSLIPVSLSSQSFYDLSKKIIEIAELRLVLSEPVKALT